MPGWLRSEQVAGLDRNHRLVSSEYAHQQPCYEFRQAQTRLAEPICQSFLSGRIDEMVVEAFLEALRPAGLDATLAALRGLEQERRDVDRQWQLRLERARYEARLAQRQYNAVDTDNRLVARELERRWETALAEAEEVQQEYGRLRLTELRPLDAVEVEDVRRLASDLPALWQADTTTPVDRKRLLRLVVASVTVTFREGRTGADVAVLWSGGARTAHRVDSPEFNAHLRTKAGTLDAIRDLASRMPDPKVAAVLVQRGLLSQHGKPWTPSRVASMRRQHHIPTGCPAQTRGTSTRADRFVPARVAARQIGIALSAIRVWAHRGVLACDQSRDTAKLWIRLEDGDANRLGGCADATGLERVRDVASRNGSSTAAVWERVRKGEFVAYRIQQGRKHWDWRLAPAHLCDEMPPVTSHLPLTQEGAAQ